MKKLLILLVVFTGISFCNAQQKDIINYIRTESIGGKLNFLKTVEKEYSGTSLIGFGDTVYNKKDFTVLLWSAKVRALGVESMDQSKKLWEEIYKRPLTEPENKALKAGFEARF